jgi:hypothetical protein
MVEGCSGADISICVREALMEPLRSVSGYCVMVLVVLLDVD